MTLDDGHAPGFQLLATEGLHPATTVQFAEGHWPGEIGAGVALNDRAFGVIEPHLRATSQAWTLQHRYSVFELPAKEATALVARLRSEVARMRGLGEDASRLRLMSSLADWLEPRSDGRHLSVLGY